MQLSLILLLFAVGWWLRWRGIMTAVHVALLLRLVINVAIPLLIVGALLRAPLNRVWLLQPLTLMLVMTGVLIISSTVARLWQLERRRAGAFVISASCINMAFSYPFVAAMRGDAAITQWVILDIGITIMTWIVLAYVAASYGGHPGEWRRALRRVLGMPPFWAIVLSISIRLADINVPDDWTALLQSAGRWMMLLVLPVMGALAVALRRLNRQLVSVVVMRAGLGFVLAAALVRLLGIAPEYQALVVYAGAAPIGFSAVAMSQRESLDVEFAGAATAVSILLALIYLPLLLMLL